jgi:hypothetical protein
MMEKPAVGSKVTFILGGGPNAGKHRTAIVVSHWSGDPIASALKTGKTVEEFEATDGMRLTLDVHVRAEDSIGYQNRESTYGYRFDVRHAEHDPDAQLLGTWH